MVGLWPPILSNIDTLSSVNPIYDETSNIVVPWLSATVQSDVSHHGIRIKGKGAPQGYLDNPALKTIPLLSGFMMLISKFQW